MIEVTYGKGSEANYGTRFKRKEGRAKSKQAAESRRVETVSMLGRTVRVVRMDDGSSLSEQKKPLELLQWRGQIVAGMVKAGFEHEEIVDVLREERSVGYFNQRFYRPPKDIVQRAIEGWYK